MPTEVTLRRNLGRGLTVEEIDGNMERLRDAVDAAAPGGSTPDATSLLKGKVRLFGALSGTADNPIALGYANQGEVDAAMTAAANTAAGSKVASSSVGAANGVAPLGADTKVPSAYLPSYVDDVLEYANLAALPATGETGKIYVTTAAGADPAGTTYRWSGSAYIKLVGSPGSTDAVPEGATNLYFSAARVRAAVLSGIDLATNAAVTVADTVMGAIGKLSARLEALIVTVAAKPDALPPITLTGATTLNRASHGNRQIIFNGANATLTISNDATGLWTADDAVEVHTATGSAGVPTLVTSDGKSIPGSATKSIGATRKGADAWTVGTTDPAAGGAGADPVSVTGSTVNGSTLTAAITAGWQNSGGTWTRNGTNIAGATALTYATVSADGGTTVTYKSASIPFVPVGIAVAAPGGSGSLSAASGTVSAINLSGADATTNFYWARGGTPKTKTGAPAITVSDTAVLSTAGINFPYSISGSAPEMDATYTAEDFALALNGNAAAGNPFYREVVVPIPAGGVAHTADVYYNIVTDSPGATSGTLTFSLDDGSATLPPIDVPGNFGGAGQKYTVTYTSAAATNLRVRVAHKSLATGSAIAFGLVAVR